MQPLTSTLTEDTTKQPVGSLPGSGGLHVATPVKDAPQEVRKVAQGTNTAAEGIFAKMGESIKRSFKSLTGRISRNVRSMYHTMKDLLLNRKQRNRELEELKEFSENASIATSGGVRFNKEEHFGYVTDYLNNHPPSKLTKSAQFAHLKAYKKYEEAQKSGAASKASPAGPEEGAISFSSTPAGILLRGHIALLEFEVGKFRDIKKSFELFQKKLIVVENHKGRAF